METTNNMFEKSTIVDFLDKLEINYDDTMVERLCSGYQSNLLKNVKLDNTDYRDGKLSFFKDAKGNIKFDFNPVVEELTIPKKLTGLDYTFSEDEINRLKERELVLIETKNNGLLGLQIDEELNKIVVQSPKEIGLDEHFEFGGYKPTVNELNDLVNGRKVGPKVLYDDVSNSYILSSFSIEKGDDNKTNINFYNAKVLTDEKEINALKDKFNTPSSLDVEAVTNIGKSAVEKDKVLDTDNVAEKPAVVDQVTNLSTSVDNVQQSKGIIDTNELKDTDSNSKERPAGSLDNLKQNVFNKSKEENHTLLFDTYSKGNFDLVESLMNENKGHLKEFFGDSSEKTRFVQSDSYQGLTIAEQAAFDKIMTIDNSKELAISVNQNEFDLAMGALPKLDKLKSLDKLNKPFTKDQLNSLNKYTNSTNLSNEVHKDYKNFVDEINKKNESRNMNNIVDNKLHNSTSIKPVETKMKL